MPTTPKTASRFDRQLILKDWGESGQANLSKASVLLIGCGGLGSAVAPYLIGAGIGRICLVDGDTVALSNLHRQVHFKEEDVDAYKAETLADALIALNSTVEIEVMAENIDAQSAAELIPEFDLVVDASDNFPTRFLLGDLCARIGVPLISGAVHQWEGQVMFFSHNNEDAINYRDVVPVSPPAGSIKNCEEEGVAGAAVAWIGSMMATLACRFFVTENSLPAEALWIIDSADFQVMPQKMIRRSDNPLRTVEYEFDEENVDYAHLCGHNHENHMKEITALELKTLMDSGEQFQLIDVREPYEFEEANLGGVLFPLGEVLDHASEIDRDVKVVVHCRAGVRSANAIRALEENFGFTNLINLKGGIIAWANDVDPSLFGG